MDKALLWVFCTHPGTLSAVLGAIGSLCLAVPWAVDRGVRRRSEKRSDDARKAHGDDHVIVQTLQEQHNTLLLGSEPRWVTRAAVGGAGMLFLSFAVAFGASLYTCPAGEVISTL